jgi:Flp pilus assembly pilin Flp
MKSFFKTFSRVTALEYGIIAALVAIAVIGFVTSIDPKPNMSTELLPERIIVPDVPRD